MAGVEDLSPERGAFEKEIETDQRQHEGKTYENPLREGRFQEEVVYYFSLSFQIVGAFERVERLGERGRAWLGLLVNVGRRGSAGRVAHGVGIFN